MQKTGINIERLRGLVDKLNDLFKSKRHGDWVATLNSDNDVYILHEKRNLVFMKISWSVELYKDHIPTPTVGHALLYVEELRIIAEIVETRTTHFPAN